MLEENEKDQYQEHIAGDLTRPWQRPGKFVRANVHYHSLDHDFKTYVIMRKANDTPSVAQTTLN